ncbi:hypothetical protein NST84_07505 [Paenibacillus sp. FSL R7-0345]|uniref:hypothetical protein n=1 Tax=Paenibacillus sp. FSL R7-0345 TaxID=2954535 RepID=UPI00315AFADB
MKSGQIAGIKGKNAFEFVKSGQPAGIKGKNTLKSRQCSQKTPQAGVFWLHILAANNAGALPG